MIASGGLKNGEGWAQPTTLFYSSGSGPAPVLQNVFARNEVVPTGLAAELYPESRATICSLASSLLRLLGGLAWGFRVELRDRSSRRHRHANESACPVCAVAVTARGSRRRRVEAGRNLRRHRRRPPLGARQSVVLLGAPPQGPGTARPPRRARHSQGQPVTAARQGGDARQHPPVAEGRRRQGETGLDAAVLLRRPRRHARRGQGHLLLQLRLLPQT